MGHARVAKCITSAEPDQHSQLLVPVSDSTRLKLPPNNRRQHMPAMTKQNMQYLHACMRACMCVKLCNCLPGRRLDSALTNCTDALAKKHAAKGGM
jgi:hypothetical protein